MTRYGFVPHGTGYHCNVCGPGDTAELAAMHPPRQGAGELLYCGWRTRLKTECSGSGLGPSFARPPADGLGVGRVSSPFAPASTYADAARSLRKSAC